MDQDLKWSHVDQDLKWSHVDQDTEVVLERAHLRESGGTFMEARLTWVRLKAELKNWRKVGRESLALLGDGGEREENKESEGWMNGWRATQLRTNTMPDQCGKRIFDTKCALLWTIQTELF